jgi:ribosomal protein S18 acetylase RimI-like enzyme
MEARRMQVEDLDRVAALYLKAYGVKWTEQGARGYLKKFFDFEPTSCLVVTEADGNIRGAILGYSFEKESGLVLFIQELFVDPECRNRGYGKVLVERFRESFAKHHTQVNIKPLVKADTSVLNFYNSLGFERDQAVSFWIDE